MLTNLGWPVNISEHPGWTGRVETSWNLPDYKNSKNHKFNTSHGGSLYDGETHVIYWADVNSEIAFVVPTHEKSQHVEGILVMYTFKNLLAYIF